MIRSVKIRLIPNKTQENLMIKSSNISRFVYNWALSRQIENHHNGNKFIYNNILRKELTQLKKTEMQFLSEVSNNVSKQAVKDCCNAYKRFFNKKSSFPKFKSKKNSKPSFYNDCGKLKIGNKKVYLEKIGWIKTSLQFPEKIKLYNPRVTFDGKYWFLSVGLEVDKAEIKLNDFKIGIDLGVKNLAICSNGKIYENINKTNRVKKIENKINKLKKQVSKKYNINRSQNIDCKYSNISKVKKKIRLLYRRLSNIRNNHIHQVTNDIVKTKPYQINIEDLNISKMMKTHYLSKAIQNQSFYKFMTYLSYKCEFYGIKLVKIDRFYPSSKTCNSCGRIKYDLKLSDRTYRCDCGYSEDRDMNASYNIRDFD